MESTAFYPAFLILIQTLAVPVISIVSVLYFYRISNKDKSTTSNAIAISSGLIFWGYYALTTKRIAIIPSQPLDYLVISTFALIIYEVLLSKYSFTKSQIPTLGLMIINSTLLLNPLLTNQFNFYLSLIIVISVIYSTLSTHNKNIQQTYYMPLTLSGLSIIVAVSASLMLSQLIACLAVIYSVTTILIRRKFINSATLRHLPLQQYLLLSTAAYYYAEVEILAIVLVTCCLIIPSLIDRACSRINGNFIFIKYLISALPILVALVIIWPQEQLY